MSTRISQPWKLPLAVTRFCFRYRSSRRHVRLYDVQIVLDSEGSACRIEIRHAAPAADDLPPLSSGVLSAARLRTTVDLLGFVEHVVRTDTTPKIPGTLVKVVHLKRSALPKQRQVGLIRKTGGAGHQPSAETRVDGAWHPSSPLRATILTSLPRALAVTRTSHLRARGRRKYPVRRP